MSRPLLLATALLSLLSLVAGAEEAEKMVRMRASDRGAGARRPLHPARARHAGTPIFTTRTHHTLTPTTPHPTGK